MFAVFKCFFFSVPFLPFLCCEIYVFVLIFAVLWAKRSTNETKLWKNRFYELTKLDSSGDAKLSNSTLTLTVNVSVMEEIKALALTKRIPSQKYSYLHIYEIKINIRIKRSVHVCEIEWHNCVLSALSEQCFSQVPVSQQNSDVQSFVCA